MATAGRRPDPGGAGGGAAGRSSVCVLKRYPCAAAKALVNAPSGPNTVLS
jgi:hypothetical protein